MDKTEAKFWRLLFDELKKAVLSNKITCPKLDLQEAEAMFDSRLEEPITEVIDELSWGLEFRLWRSILDCQIEDAARQFLGKPIEERIPCAIAFESDPQAPVESRMTIDIGGTKTRVNVHLSLPSEVAEQDRKLKEEYEDIAQELLNKYRDNPLGWSQLLEQSKKSTVDGYIGEYSQQSIAKRLAEDSPWSQLSASSDYARLVNFWSRLNLIGIDTGNKDAVMRFANSSDLLDSPFIDIFSSIYAVIAAYFPERKSRASDMYDATIMATTLPYCDIITTDKFMKEILVNILKFDKEYEVKVFSATVKDRLAFQKLVR